MCPVDEVFFGGTRGGGKTDCAIGRQIHGAEKYGGNWNGLFIRRKYKDLAEVRRRFDGMIRAGLPAERVGGENQTNYIRFHRGPGAGATIVLAAINRIELAESYQGQQFTEITIDEAPQIPFISRLIDNMKGCLRSPHGVPARMFLTGNPGGSGASQIKMMYIGNEDGGSAPSPEGAVNRITRALPDGTEHTFTRVFIKSMLDDNRILMEKDPQYKIRLLSIQNEALRRAWMEGRWDVMVGQAFTFTDRHVIDPIWPIPDEAPIYMTFDWGFGAPFSIGWWWVDEVGRLYRFAEWYGWDEVNPNVGLRLEDPKVAAGIIEREQQIGISGRNITRLAGRDCFAKKPDYKGGGQGPATSEEFKEYGRAHGYDLTMIPGDPDRELKIRQFRSRLMLPDNSNDLPMLVVYRSCVQFIRIIPDLCVDELSGEYLEPGQELHPFDESCHVCMARPIEMDDTAAGVARVEAAQKAARAKLDDASLSATLEYESLIKRATQGQVGADGWDIIDDRDWYQTVQ